MKYIDAEKLLVKIKGLQCEQGFDTGEAERAYQIAIKDILDFITSLKQEQPEVDVEKKSELIANGIMISVQANKYGTNIYNTERNDFNHHHLQMAARKGIEFGLKAQKGE